MLRWEACGASHVGGRDENQDEYVVRVSDDASEVLVLVADGMGGHRGGADAARLAAGAADEVWSGRGEDRPLDELLADLVASAHSRIQSLNRERETDSQTTLAALWLRGDEAVSVHVGDSRVQQFASGELVARTRDHSMAQLHVISGRITEDELADHPDQATLLTSVGSTRDPDPEYVRWDLAQGDAFVVCSDGFWEIVPPELQARWLAEDSPGPALERGIHECLEAADEDHDNTTAVLVRRRGGVSGPRSVRRIFAYAALAVVLAAIVATAWVWMSAPDGPPDGAEVVPEASGPDADSVEGGDPDGIPPRGSGDPEADVAEGEAAPAEGGESSGTQATEGRREGGIAEDATARLEPVDLSTDFEWSDDAGAEAVAERLREAGIFGERDSLETRRETDTGADARTIRLEARHGDLPVWASVVTVRVEAGRVVEVNGRVPRDIDLPEEPLLSFPEAVDRIVADNGGPDYTAIDTGVLYVLRLADGSYTRAWQGRVRGDREWRVLVDAHGGDLLVRWSGTTERPSP